MVCLPVVVVGGADVVAGLAEQAVGLELGLAQVCLCFLLGVVDTGGRGLLLGDSDAQLARGVDEGSGEDFSGGFLRGSSCPFQLRHVHSPVPMPSRQAGPHSRWGTA